MPTVTITSLKGTSAGSVELPDTLFDAQASIPLMHQVVVAQLAAARQGTHSTKTRGEVSGGGKKPYRQKGTGRARQGSIRSPQFAGGGVAHGPQPHDYVQRTPKKMKAAALRGALSDRARNGALHVVSALVDGDKPSTKTAKFALRAVTSKKNVLVVLSRAEELAWMSLRNLDGVHLLFADQLNTYDVLVSEDVVFTKTALDEFVAFQQPVAAAVTLVDVPVTAAVADDAADDEVVSIRDFGPGSHAALADGSQPEGFDIKGNADSMLYHVPGSAFYARTVAEVWFDSADTAEAAGFQLPPSQRSSEEDAK